jgi:streptogramin lyase
MGKKSQRQKQTGKQQYRKAIMKNLDHMTIAVLGLLLGFGTGPALPAASAAGALLVTSTMTHAVVCYDVTTKQCRQFIPAASGGLAYPFGFTLGPDGNLYVACYYLNNVKRYDGHTGAFIDTFASGGGLNGPVNLVFGPDGSLYASGWLSHNLLRYNGTNGAFMDVFIPAGRGGLNQAAGVIFASGDNLYVASYGTGQVLCFDAISGAYKSVFIRKGSGGLVGPTAMTMGPDGNLYVSDYGDNKVLRYDGTNGAFISVVVPRQPSNQPGAVDQPTGLLVGPDGNLYVCCNNMDCIKRYDGVTGAFMDVFASAGSCGLDYPARIAFVCPTTLTCEQDAGAGTLQLCWTSPMHRLQAQTNGPAGGLTTNWFDYPGGTNSPVTVPLDPQQHSVFFRLTWP